MLVINVAKALEANVILSFVPKFKFFLYALHRVYCAMFDTKTFVAEAAAKMDKSST